MENNSNLIYNVNEKPKTLKEWILYPLQQVVAILTATLLISSVCGAPLSSGVFSAGIGTIVYLILTRFKSPMFVSNAGATCSAVITSLSLSGGNTATVIIGGAITMVLYALIALGVKIKGTKWLNQLFSTYTIGSIIMVIGINLSKFSVSYAQVNGEYSLIGMIVAFFVMTITALTARYGKGFLKTIPFLIGLAAGYIACLCLELFGIHLLNLSAFNNLTLFSIPDFSFNRANFITFDWNLIPQIIVLWIATSIPMCLEHLGDHKSLSSVIGVDLTQNPGIHRTLFADGVASFIGCIFGQTPNTSYGESISCTAVSRVGSSYVIFSAACTLVVASFFTPLMAFFESISSTIFCGVSLIAYGMIAFSGLNMLIKSNINYNDTSKVMVVCAILTTGISGLELNIGPITFSGVSLAMLTGLFLDWILNIKNKSLN